jgi:hypothetical protein
MRAGGEFEEEFWEHIENGEALVAALAVTSWSQMMKEA